MTLRSLRFGLLALAVLWIAALVAVGLRGEVLRTEVRAAPCFRAYSPFGTAEDVAECVEVRARELADRPVSVTCIPLRRVLTDTAYRRFTICPSYPVPAKPDHRNPDPRGPR